MPNINFRDSQSFILGSGFQVAAAQHTLIFNAQRDVMLGRLNIQTSGVNPGSGMINTLTVQGQSLLTSNAGASIRGTFPELADDGANYMGCPLIANGQVSITTGNYLGGVAPINRSIVGGIFCAPWDTSVLGPVPPPDSIGSSGLNFLYGLGQNVIPIGGVATTFNITSLRDVQLGMLYLDAYDLVLNSYLTTANAADVTVSSIRINQTEQLTSTIGVPLSCFGLNSKDEDMKTLAVVAPMNSTCSITIVNNHINPVTVSGHFFALPG